jgi:hypothetical protein
MATTTPPEPVASSIRTTGSTDDVAFAALLACVRAGTSNEGLARRLERVTDWSGLRDLAIHQATLPLLYSRISRAAPSLVPAHFLAELQAISRANAERCIRHSVALLRIVDALRDAGIDSVPFKGPLLSEYAYNDVAIRYFQDLDIFVAGSQLDRACEILGAMGFPTRHTTAPAARAHGQDFHAILEGHGLMLEVHWRTGPAFVPPVFHADELLRRARPATLLGRPILTLDPADLLLALCVHGDAHRWPQLEPVATLARVLARREYGDPGEFLWRARSRGALRRCTIAFLLAQRLAGAPLPPEVEAAIAKDRRARILALKAADLIRSYRDLGDTRLITTLWRALALDRPQDSVRLATLQVFAPRNQGMMESGESRSSAAAELLRRVRYLQGSLRRH